MANRPDTNADISKLSERMLIAEVRREIERLRENIASDRTFTPEMADRLERRLIELEADLLAKEAASHKSGLRGT